MILYYVAYLELLVVCYYLYHNYEPCKLSNFPRLYKIEEKGALEFWRIIKELSRVI